MDQEQRDASDVKGQGHRPSAGHGGAAPVPGAHHGREGALRRAGVRRACRRRRAGSADPERARLLEQARLAAEHAEEHIRTHGGDPASVADAIWASADLFAATAGVNLASALARRGSPVRAATRRGQSHPATIALAQVMSRCAHPIIAFASVSVVEIIP